MSKNPPIVALLTDFGLLDHYVSVLKGVMLSVCPSLRIVDVSHDIAPQDIQQAAYLLWASYSFLPDGTVFVCVVDPGVGSSREIIIAETRHHVFVAPHNGLLDLVLWQERVKKVTTFRQESPKSRSILPRSISSTFHGRDIFAPLGTHLALGARLSSFGPERPVDWLDEPFVNEQNEHVQPKVLHVDRFGNIITNIDGANRRLRLTVGGIEIGSQQITHWVENFDSAPTGVPCLLCGSTGLVEIIFKNKSAAGYFHADRSLPLTILRP
jgi:S-adenosylmethionine hydrolase